MVGVVVMQHNCNLLVVLAAVVEEVLDYRITA